jgi:protease I
VTVRKNKAALKIMRAVSKTTNQSAAICRGPYTLVSADVTKGRHLAGFLYDGVPEEIKAAGGLYKDKEVVVDGNLVTSRWPADLSAFIRETMKIVRRYRK